MKKLLAQTPFSIGEYTQPTNTDAFKPTAEVGVSLERMLSLAVGMLTLVSGLAFLIYFFIGTLSWTLAGSDEGKVEKAKKQMTNGAIGLIIVVMAYTIIAVLGNLVGLKLLNPACELARLQGVGATAGLPWYCQ